MDWSLHLRDTRLEPPNGAVLALAMWSSFSISCPRATSPLISCKLAAATIADATPFINALYIILKILCHRVPTHSGWWNSRTFSELFQDPNGFFQTLTGLESSSSTCWYVFIAWSETNVLTSCCAVDYKVNVEGRTGSEAVTLCCWWVRSAHWPLIPGVAGAGCVCCKEWMGVNWPLVLKVGWTGSPWGTGQSSGM